MTENVSHGRGGQGNIGPDPTPYADAGIVREGPVGDQGDGAYSAGRGGAGNIGSPGLKPTSGNAHDREVVPELSIQPGYEDYHVGRGGKGNEHHEGHSKADHSKVAHEGLADKLKNKILGKK
ncbi:hypothetical protein UCRPC4_g06678 [Phaeomoniella chlamydospora]|uniref:Uncharacterized protein n=1 Tax=Phaeomoniella chlamydospora TaxID=158046 RepID=A0A0G2DVC7_PHACM|nr:hypothetical protein UCRPC4_g06678 [Phaeomoniella chlamydospora]